MKKEEILKAAEKAFSAFTHYCNGVNENIFFDKPSAKWSVAENIQHLIVSTNTSTLAFSLPKFLVRWAGGTPNRKSRTYDELVAKYKNKLAEGGTASGRFIPKPMKLNFGKQKLMMHWNSAALDHIAAIKKTRPKKN